MTRTIVLFSTLLALSSLLSLSKSPDVTAQALSRSRPNIIFILADDFSTNLLPYMPNVLGMQKDGMTFTNFFVTDSLCCPSRASIFTGQFPHNNGILFNWPPDGGFVGYVNKGNPARSFAAALQKGGYRTAMMGKFLNRYDPKLPPVFGWDEWHVTEGGYGNFNYVLNENGVQKAYGKKPEDYLTDVIAQKALALIPQTQPYFIELATFAPHRPYTPAPRDANLFPELTIPRTPAFAARPDTSAPKWLLKAEALTPSDIATMEEDFRNRVRSVQAIDKMIGDIRTALKQEQQEGNTYLVFASDNGYHLGEHSLLGGKRTAFDVDIHVPLIIVGPGISPSSVADAMTSTIDLSPTFLEWGQLPPPPAGDGRSLVPLLQGKVPTNWRQSVFIEHQGPNTHPDDPDVEHLENGNPPTYKALRTKNQIYIEYVTGETQFHDMKKDPFELTNTISTLSPIELERWHRKLAALAQCKGAQECSTDSVPE